MHASPNPSGLGLFHSTQTTLHPPEPHLVRLLRAESNLRATVGCSFEMLSRQAPGLDFFRGRPGLGPFPSLPLTLLQDWDKLARPD